MKKSIVISGFGMVPPSQQLGLGLTPDLGLAADKLPRRLTRFSTRSTAAAFTATKAAFAMAQVETEQLGSRFGLYCAQTGVQHCDADDCFPALQEKSAEQSDFEAVWLSRSVSPFIALKMLGNNLSGLLSIAWQLRGDACSFARDEAGAATALAEAISNLQAGIIDSALVVCGGVVDDQLTAIANDQPYQQQVGAAAIFLQTEQRAQQMQSPCLVNIIAHQQAFLPEQTRLAATDTTQGVLAEQQLVVSPQQSWGGVLAGLAQSTQLLIQQKQQSQLAQLAVISQDPHGLNCSVTVSLSATGN